VDSNPAQRDGVRRSAAKAEAESFASECKFKPQGRSRLRLTLPEDVYRKVVHSDLRDLRVFNSGGEVVRRVFGIAALRTVPWFLISACPSFQLRGVPPAELIRARSRSRRIPAVEFSA